MKISLSTDIQVEVGSDEFLDIQVRDLTKKEENSFQKKLKGITDASKKGQRLERRINNIERRLDVITDKDQTLALIDKLEKMEDERDDLIDEFSDKGIDKLNSLYKEKFDLVVAGKGKDRLHEIAELRGFKLLLELIDKAKTKAESEGN